MKSLTAILLSLTATLALAAPPSTNVEITPEQRKQMADMHTKAAACLNSNKSMQECREEMMKNCPMVKDGHCPMMGMGMSPMMGKGAAPAPQPKTTK